MGTAFLRKFTFVLDQEKQVLGFYQTKKKTLNTNLLLKILLIIACIIIIILIILLMYYKNNQKIRKVRANELESDIDYNPIS